MSDRTPAQVAGIKRAQAKRMARLAARRFYPLAPLVRLLDLRGYMGEGAAFGIPITEARFGRIVRISGRTLRKYQSEGIPEARADELAVRLLNLPAPLVWPEYHEEVPAEELAS